MKNSVLLDKTGTNAGLWGNWLKNNHIDSEQFKNLENAVFFEDSKGNVFTLGDIIKAKDAIGKNKNNKNTVATFSGTSGIAATDIKNITLLYFFQLVPFILYSIESARKK